VRAVVITDDRRLEEREVETPEPGAGQVRTRAQTCFDDLLSPRTEHLKVLLTPSR
jgi:hypothetical protein